MYIYKMSVLNKDRHVNGEEGDGWLLRLVELECVCSFYLKKKAGG